MPEQEQSIRFTVYVDTYGHKSKCVRDVGQSIAKALYAQFGNKFRMVDHRSQPVDYDPNKHDWGFGET